MAASLSIVIPVLNEDRLAAFIDAVRSAISDSGRSAEIVIVHDGAVALRENGSDVRLIAGPKRGKGAAVREGLRAARGEITFVIDADLDVLLPHLGTFADLIEKGSDVVIAERQPEWNARGPMRFVLSYGLFLAQRLFMFNSRRFVDTQCGFKAFRTPIAAAMAERQCVDGGMYDIEYLYMAVRARLRIAQVPVGVLRESRPSKLRIWRCLWQDPVALLRVKLRGMTGVYPRRLE
jgi:dolichyl-phosphate beta-glucosyltransferase